MNGNAVRINISLPSDLVKDLKKVVPKRGVSKFLTEAASEKLRAIKAQKALEEILAGPPTFTEIKDSVAWVRKMRLLDEKRMKRLGI